MQKLITVTFDDINGHELTGDSLVEFRRYDEDGKIVNEVVKIYLPEYVPATDEKELKEDITRRFHDGEGENL